MGDNTFEVVFSGKIVEGASVDQVKGNVAKLFKVEVAKVERLFSGARVAIKKGLDETTAKKYQMALAKAGALCEVVNTAGSVAAEATKAEVSKPQAPEAPSAPAVTAAPAAPAQSAPAVQESTPGLIKYVVKEAPGGLGDLATATLDEPGVVLVEHQDVAPPELDLGGLSMDEPGVILGEHEEVAPPEVDINGISMAEPGADLGEAEEVAELQVDVSGLSMDEPGVILVEHHDVPEPQIDTSKLSVS